MDKADKVWMIAGLMLIMFIFIFKPQILIDKTPTPTSTAQQTLEPTQTAQSTPEPTPQPTAEPTLEPIEIISLGKFQYTYYTNSVADCGNTKGITFSGTRAIENLTVAVDTRIIPLGSFLYLENVGFAVAQDIGSAVKGKLIDIYYEGEVEDPQEFGQVFILLGGD